MLRFFPKLCLQSKNYKRIFCFKVFLNTTSKIRNFLSFKIDRSLGINGLRLWLQLRLLNNSFSFLFRLIRHFDDMYHSSGTWRCRCDRCATFFRPSSFSAVFFASLSLLYAEHKIEQSKTLFSRFHLRPPAIFEAPFLSIFLNDENTFYSIFYSPPFVLRTRLLIVISLIR